MSFTKHASLEDVEILDIKGSQSQRVASLDKLADFEDFRTDDGYLYARIRAISSRVNKNHDGWPSVELAGGQDVFDRHAGAKTGAFTAAVDKEASYGYSTFLGKPIFVDHNNSDPSRSRGVIVDAKLHVEDQKTAALDPYYAGSDVNPLHTPPTWVELLLEVDAKSFPKFAQAIIEGGKDSTQGIDGFSMGANVERTECNICKNSATTPDEFCKHIQNKGALYDYHDPETGQKTAKRSYEDCFGCQFFEISGVFDPADETALVREVVSNVNKESALHENPNPKPDPMGEAGTIACQNCEGRGYGKDLEDCQACHGTGRFGPEEGYRPPSPGGDGGASPQFLDSGDFTLPPINREDKPKMLGKVAGNPEPQSELIHVPDEVDTLRKERICDICGSNMDSEQCDVCGYIEPPEGLDNPDLDKADPAKANEDIEQEPEGLASNPPATAHVNSSEWKINMPSRVAETVVTPSKGPASDEPEEEIVKDPAQPVTSSVRTAADFIAAAGSNKQGANMKREAEAATGAPAAATPDTNVDVNGVGGVQDASNEQASKADTQTDVLGIGGTGEEAVESDSTVSVDQGDEHSKNVERIPTKTFGQGNSAVERQRDPVTGQPFPTTASQRRAFGIGDIGNAVGDAAGAVGGAVGQAADTPGGFAGQLGVPGASSIPSFNDAAGAVGNALAPDPNASGSSAIDPNNIPGSFIQSSWRIEALDSGAFPRTEDSAAGGSATPGVGPTDPVGNAQNRVNLLDPATSPGNNSGPTKTWSGTDGNGVLRQQDPTTPTSLEEPDGVKASNTKLMQSFKLADLEIDLGMLDKSQKYARIDELQNQSPDSVVASLSYAEKVKTAGLAKGSAKTASRFPSLARSASVESSKSGNEVTPDEALFS